MTLNDGREDDWTYVWNGENRLVEVTSPGWKLRFIYDHQGRRIQKHVYSWNPSDPEPAAPSRGYVYIYDGWNLVAELELEPELNSSFTIQNSSFFTWGKDLSGSLQGAGGVGGLLMVQKNNSPFPIQNSLFYYPTFDANGNVSEYLSETGTIVAHYEYDPFGNTTVFNYESVDFPHRFSTKYFDSETSLYYYGYRYYSPELGRWLNRDPIGEAGGMNIYCFVDNRSEGLADLLGLTVVVSDQIFPGSKPMGFRMPEFPKFFPVPLPSGQNNYYRVVEDGFSGVVLLRRITVDDVAKELKVLFRRLRVFEKADGVRTRRYQREFDSSFFAGPHRQHQYYFIEYWDEDKGSEFFHQIFADNEINYIGIGMYEAWMEDPCIMGHAITLRWKQKEYGEFPSKATVDWQTVGYDSYSILSEYYPAEPVSVQSFWRQVWEQLL